MTRQRAFKILGVAAAVAVLLSGCTIPSHGVLAIGKSAHGDAIGVVQVCSHNSIDSIDVFPSTLKPYAKPRTWTFRPITDFGVRDLPGMRTRMRAGLDYYSDSFGSNDRAEGPYFDAEAFDRLRPGQVLSMDLDKGGVATMSVEAFKLMVLAHCSDFR